ncbi:cyclic GMP-AMP synthase-like receptor [Montipora capricornis]|uniref:cyclic GMP-AMP synthase-like receptor n=1 Tax=Montipora capricornis TaxID=246305 RepID=UPI0035F1EA43
MASNVVIEETLMKLDKLHSVDYENEEVQLLKSKVETIVEFISQKIAELNPILSNTVVQCGSFYHSSKITAPDEFDYILVLTKFSQPNICSCKPFPDPEYPQLVSLEIDYKTLDWLPISVSEMDDNSTSLQGVLQATLESDYRNAIRSCLATLVLPEGLSFATSQKSIRVTVGDQTFLASVKFSGPASTLLLNWKGVHYPNLNISVDMTYMVLVEGLPQFCNLEQRLHSMHPIIISKLCDEANHLLFYTRMLDDTWRVTFTSLENKIMHFWFKENDFSNVCYRLLKIIRDLLMPIDQLGETILKTYVMKTLFLNESEQYPEKRFWTREQLPTRLLCIFQKLLVALQKRFLSSYFDEKQNALSYPLDSEPDGENSDEDNHFIAKVHKATCQVTKDIIRALESSFTSDQALQVWFQPVTRTVITDPDIPNPLESSDPGLNRTATKQNS